MPVYIFYLLSKLGCRIICSYLHDVFNMLVISVCRKEPFFLPMLFITWTNLIVLSELSFNVIHSLLILLSCLCADYLLLIVYVTYVLTSGSWILLNLVCSLLIVTCIQRKMNLFASSGLFSLVMLSCSLIF